MTTYRCQCGCTFDASEATVEQTYGADYRDVETTNHCPDCGSEDFERVYLCRQCGEHESTPDDEYCRDCLTLLAVEEGERIHDEKREAFV